MDEQCLCDFKLLELLIRACLEQAAFVGQTVLGGFVVAESAMFFVQDSQLMDCDSIVLLRWILYTFLALVSEIRSLCPYSTVVLIVTLLVDY